MLVAVLHHAIKRVLSWHTLAPVLISALLVQHLSLVARGTSCVVCQR